MSTCQVGRHRSWPVPTALRGLSAAPVTTGTLRLVQLAGGPAVAGLLVAPAALCMTLFYQAQPGTGSLLLVLRLTFASAMAGFLVLGVTAARRHDIAAHRAWMIRAYAIGLAAGTQAFTDGLGGAHLGHGVLAADLAKSAGRAVNLAVAEWAVRRSTRSRGTRPATGQPDGAQS